MSTVHKIQPGTITTPLRFAKTDENGSTMRGIEHAHIASAFQTVPQITHDLGVCGGAARLRGTRVTVWGLVEWRQLGLSDAEILKRHPSLTQANLNAAWAYYGQNRQEVDQAIRENQEA